MLMVAARIVRRRSATMGVMHTSFLLLGQPR
jgi:hypothetical protein